jgi:hypothetical protein
MKIRSAALIIAPVLFASTARAQYERYEFFADYSYLRFDPTVAGFQTRSLNGGGGGLQVNFNKWFGLKADFQDYGSTSWTVRYPGRKVTPMGIIPAGTYTSSNANVFTWVFGPVVRIPAKKVIFFGETLFGGSYTNAYAALSEDIISRGGSIPVIGTEHPFTMTVGGGIDLKLSKLVALRLGEVDYVLTRYDNPLTNSNNQNSFRFVAGFVIKLGGPE